MACDGYISLKILELVFSVVCIIYKRVTDDESNRLFYYLQKLSREWPLLNNITWDENGAIFVDVGYGGFVLICIGLLIGQASGELFYAPKMEKFFLTLGALMFIAAGSLELAALDSVEHRLVDNAAILGVLSLIAGLIFIIDLLLISKRRKTIKPTNLRTLNYEKTTQTESRDQNGNVEKKIPANGVKILPSSPPLEEDLLMKPSMPVYTAHELRSPHVKIKSTESFLRSEKGEPIIPPGYMLVPRPESTSPPGYAAVEPRKLQSPTVTSTGYYFDSREPSPTDSYRIDEKVKYPPPFVRNTPFRSSRVLDKPQFGSLDGRHLAEELRAIRDITKSDLNIAKENQTLKEILMREKEQRLRIEKSDLEERKRLEERLSELEEYQAKLEKDLRSEERKKLDIKIKELAEEEKDRRMSEKEVQYFGIDDVRESEKQSSPIASVNRDLKELKAAQNNDEELRKVIEEGFQFLDEEDERKRRSGLLYKEVEDTRSKRQKTRSLPKESLDLSEGAEAASYKSEAQFWLPGRPGTPLSPKDSGYGRSPSPMSPKDPGYVMHTAMNWPDPTSDERFRFSAKKANMLRSETPSPDYPELMKDNDRIKGRGRGLLLRKVDFPEDPVTVEFERPSTAIGNTNSWRKWLQPKVKLQASKSTPT